MNRTTHSATTPAISMLVPSSKLLLQICGFPLVVFRQLSLPGDSFLCLGCLPSEFISSFLVLLRETGMALGYVGLLRSLLALGVLIGVQFLRRGSMGLGLLPVPLDSFPEALPLQLATFPRPLGRQSHNRKHDEQDNDGNDDDQCGRHVAPIPACIDLIRKTASAAADWRRCQRESLCTKATYLRECDVLNCRLPVPSILGTLG